MSSVEQSGMVTGKCGGNEVPERRLGDGVFGTGGSVIDFFENFVGVRVARFAKVVLECGGELSEVMPEPG